MRVIGRLWQRIMQIRSGVVALSVLLTIFNLPLKAEQVPEAFRWWVSIMPSRETLFMIFSGVLVAWIFWIDLRASVYKWWKNKRRKIYVSDINIADELQPTTEPVQFIGMATRNESQLRVVVEHSYYATWMGGAGFYNATQVDLDDLKNVIAARQIIIPITRAAARPGEGHA